MKSLFLFIKLVFITLLFNAPVSATTEQAKTPLRLCAVYPHLKDSYWLSINFGMTERAKQRAVSLKVLEAGGYKNSSEQWTQIEQCLQWQADAILVGAVYFEQLSTRLAELNKTVPLFGLVNEVSTTSLTGRTGVSWYQMGAKLGQFLSRKHPKTNSTKKLKLAWFPGPNSGGGSQQSTLGLQDALKNSDVEIVSIKHGLNNKMRQFSLINETLAEFVDKDGRNELDYLAGNAIMAEMAIGELAKLEESERPQILSHYLSHGVYRGILRGKILMANSDQMVLQGAMAIDQATDYLLKRKITKDQAPEILTLTKELLAQFPTEQSLSPSYFKPVYSVNP
ncbi:TMAO reductase system periplasmic protein TorT [Moritella sp. Urea-trap-13]|uniref:TMAO reductase system periplasmic protein TorT n=1 Tax=Moritella sp. Urea-trap-13 TaxID=2058327 RepID=UPI001E299A50|nr:TMAO reductase system periplasmic protein TorT [Moritella sp. Urea-trap-13]